MTFPRGGALSRAWEHDEDSGGFTMVDESLHEQG